MLLRRGLIFPLGLTDIARGRHDFAMTANPNAMLHPLAAPCAGRLSDQNDGALQYGALQ